MRAPDACSYAAVDAYVDRELRRLNVPGAFLAIVEGLDGIEGRIVHQRGFGHAHPASPPPPTPQTPFFIGSVTKSFTALAVMQLVERGVIDLDAPVQRYLPWFSVADPEAAACMTVRHLLNQTSGFSMTLGSAVLGDLDARPDAAERQARALNTYWHTQPPGAAFAYSNVNYNLLGLIVEAASGEPYAEYVQNCIFNPLGMTHTYVSKAPARQDSPHGDDLATGHRYWFWRPIPEPDLPVATGSLAAGQLISCGEDLARYLIAHLNGGRFGAVQILSAKGIAEMHRGAVEINAMGQSVGWYGMGWFVSNAGSPGDLRGGPVVSHSGLVPNFAAFVGLLPAQKKGLVLLLNAGHFWMEPLMNELGAGATQILAGGDPQPGPFAWVRHVPAVMRLLPLIPLLQAVRLILALRSRRVMPALLPNLALAALPLALRWAPRTRPLGGFMKLYAPDAWWLAHLSGSLALAASALRGCRSLVANRKGCCDD